MKKKYLILFSIIVATILFYYFCTTIVYQGETHLVMMFGKPVRVITEPGIYLKLPTPFHKVQIIDARLTLFEPRPSEFLTSDKKNLIFESGICYRIKDPIMFIKTVRDLPGLQIRLTDLLSSHTGLLLGTMELSSIININREELKFVEMNNRLTKLIQEDGIEFGIDVVQVFIKSIMLPDDNKIAVYDRMRAERDRIAQKYIAEGEEQALTIRAEADKESRTIIAEATSKANVIKGEADAEAMNIYGSAYNKNPAFYSYIRSLQAYENSFDKNTTIILDENSNILKTLFKGDN